MNRRFWIFVVVVSFAAASLVPLAAQGKDVPRSLVKFTNESLAAIGRDAQLVEFVATSNASPQDVAKLRELDTKWQKKDGIEDLVKALLDSACSARLAKTISACRFVPEAFIMNAQGTIIGETNRTSTYWKGEQEKFTAAYKGGAGAIWYGKLEFDESTKTNVVQISVPVLKDGKAVGVICFGINVDDWEKR